MLFSLRRVHLVVSLGSANDNNNVWNVNADGNVNNNNFDNDTNIGVRPAFY